MRANEKKLLDSCHVRVRAEHPNPSIVCLGSASGIVKGNEAQGASPASRSQYNCDRLGQSCDVPANLTRQIVDLRVERRRFPAAQSAGAVSSGVPKRLLMTEGGPAARSGLPKVLEW
jgi:hypothetical protein